MKQVNRRNWLFLFGLLCWVGFQPLALRAGDPPPITCKCLSDTSYLNKADILTQYREMFIPLYLAGERDKIKALDSIMAFQMIKPGVHGASVRSLAFQNLLIGLLDHKSPSFAADTAALDSFPIVPKNLNNLNFPIVKTLMACKAIELFVKGYQPKTDSGNELSEEPPPTPEPWCTQVPDWFWALLAFLLVLTSTGSLLWLQQKLKKTPAAATSTTSVPPVSNNDNTRAASSDDPPAGKTPERTLPSYVAITPPEPKPPEPMPVYQPPTPPPPLRKIYASVPNNLQLFHGLSENFEPQRTYFVIEVNRDGQTGTFKLVDDEATRQYAFSLIDSLKSACDLLSTGSPSANQRLLEERPGKVEREGDYWKITQKMVLKW